ncbi:MAG: ketoacyl-ACP synthase III, partial [Actinomycetota bacterium]|nr:ketoacyl-ACP synthase III [Actinomycetota bacterium]
MTVAITGVGSALPRRVVGNEEFDSIGTSDAWIVRRTGIHQRRWLAADESVADLATSACAEAIKP